MASDTKRVPVIPKHPQFCNCSACDLCFVTVTVAKLENESGTDEEYAAWLTAELQADISITSEAPATLYADRLTITDGDMSFLDTLLHGAQVSVEVPAEAPAKYRTRN